MSEIKACPFCGVMPDSYNDDGVNFYWCANEDCENFDQVCGICEAAWNTRPIEDALTARIAELEAEVTKSHELQDSYCERIAVLYPAVGLMTTLKPTMVMDAEHPLEMAIEVAEYVTARIAELEAAQRQKWTPVSERLPEAGHKVLVLLTDGAISIDFIHGNDFLGNPDFYEYWVGDITHWMPLPKLPEVQE